VIKKRTIIIYIILKPIQLIQLKKQSCFSKTWVFVIDKVADIKYFEMSSFKFFIKSMSLRHLIKIKKAGQLPATWQLRAI